MVRWESEGSREGGETCQTRVVVPMHYQTFPVLASSAKGFPKIVREMLPEVRVVVLKPSEVYQL